MSTPTWYGGCPAGWGKTQKSGGYLACYPRRVPPEEQSIRIDGDLVAQKEPDREAWEIRDANGVQGRVVKEPGGFDALRPEGDDFSLVGTFISLETAARALSH